MEILSPEAVSPNYNSGLVLAVSPEEAKRPFISSSDTGTWFELLFTKYNAKLPPMPLVDHNGVFTWVVYPRIEAPF